MEHGQYHFSGLVSQPFCTSFNKYFSEFYPKHFLLIIKYITQISQHNVSSTNKSSYIFTYFMVNLCGGISQDYGGYWETQECKNLGGCVACPFNGRIKAGKLGWWKVCGKTWEW